MEIRKEKRFIAHRYSRAILFNHYKLFFDPIFQTSSVVKFSKLVTIYWRINIDTFRCSLVSSPPCFFPPQIFPRDGSLIGDFLSVKKKEKKRRKEIALHARYRGKTMFWYSFDICLNILGVVSPNLPPARNERTRGEQPWPSG